MAATSVKSPNRKEVPSSARRIKPAEIADEALDVLASTQVIDIHTHLYSPAFGRIGLWGIDELLTYHYLEAEFFRSSDTTPEEYWKLSKIERADAIWKALFVENSPVSESTRSEEHTSELQSPYDLVCRLLLEKKKIIKQKQISQAHIQTLTTN